jgi:hypothetical protein
LNALGVDPYDTESAPFEATPGETGEEAEVVTADEPIPYEVIAAAIQLYRQRETAA